MKVFKVTYSFTEGEKMDWTATILADDSEKALQFLSKILNKKFTMSAIELLGKVDGIADEIIHRVLALHGFGEKKEKPVKPIPNSKQEPLTLGDGDEVKAKRQRGKRITTAKV